LTTLPDNLVFGSNAPTCAETVASVMFDSYQGG
jgi:hypothetical protein